MVKNLSFLKDDLLTLYCPTFNVLKKGGFGKHLEGEDAGNQHFLIFPKNFFLSFQKQISIFKSHLFCRLQKLLIWTDLNFCRFACSILFHSVPSFNPFPKEKFYTSKLKEFADDNLIFDENGRKLSERVENIVRKGEIARY